MAEIILKNLAQTGRCVRSTVTLTERLPDYVESVDPIDYEVGIQDKGDFYLLDLHSQGDVTIICQRCGHTFKKRMAQHTTLAVCATDELAEQKISSYECIVADFKVDMRDILTDNLFLDVPFKHELEEDCKNLI